MKYDKIHRKYNRKIEPLKSLKKRYQKEKYKLFNTLKHTNNLS